MNQKPAVLAAALIDKAERNVEYASKPGYWRRWEQHLQSLATNRITSGDLDGAEVFSDAATYLHAYTQVRVWAADTNPSTPHDVGLLDESKDQA